MRSKERLWTTQGRVRKYRGLWKADGKKSKNGSILTSGEIKRDREDGGE